MAVTTQSPVEVEKIPAHSWYALGVLTLVYVLNFLDRALVFIQMPLIRHEFEFSDFQLGLLGSASFAVFYTLLGIPFGRLADRTRRKWLIAGGLAVWSIFSGLTGFAGSFWTLFACRLMVGVGEATLGPSALSLLSDYFPPRMRATVQSVYSSGIAVGGGLAFFLGGQIGAAWGWRWAFYLLGFPGLVMCLFVLSLKDARRGQTEGATAAAYTSRDWKVLFKSSALRYHYAGYALFGLAANQLTIWGPLFFTRVHGFPLKLVGTAAGVLSVAAGVPGTILGGLLADRLRRRGRGGRMLFSAACALACVPLWLALLFSGNVWLLLLSNFLLLGAALMWLGPAAADVHDIAGPHLRGLGVAIYFFTVNIAAYGIGGPLVGRVSDALGAAEHPHMMRYGLLLCPVASLLSALLLWRGGRKLEVSSRAEL
jgi:MFS family permease